MTIDPVAAAKSPITGATLAQWGAKAKPAELDELAREVEQARAKLRPQSVTGDVFITTSADILTRARSVLKNDELAVLLVNVLRADTQRPLITLSKEELARAATSNQALLRVLIDKHRAAVTCVFCGKTTHRVYTGDSADRYKCPSCGRELTVEWHKLLPLLGDAK